MTETESDADETSEAQTPPVPPVDSYRFESDDAPRGESVVERRTAPCSCGGTFHDYRRYTGYLIVDVWPDDLADEYDTESEARPQFEQFSRCNRCGLEVSY